MKKEYLSRQNLIQSEVYRYEFDGDDFYCIGICLESRTDLAYAIKIDKKSGIVSMEPYKAMTFATHISKASDDEIGWVFAVKEKGYAISYDQYKGDILYEVY